MKLKTALTIVALVAIFAIGAAFAASSLSIGSTINVKNPAAKNWLVVVSNVFGTNPTFTCPTTGFSDTNLNIAPWNVASGSSNSTVICLFNGSSQSQTFTVTGPTTPTGVTFTSGPATATMSPNQVI